jgi:hypothetical protein
MKPEEWVQAMGTQKVRLDITHAAQYAPRESQGRQTDFDSALTSAWGTLTEYAAALKAMTAGPR